MAYCDVCGNYDDSHLLECGIEEKSYEDRPDYQPDLYYYCLLYTSPSPRDEKVSRMPSSA